MTADPRPEGRPPATLLRNSTFMIGARVVAVLASAALTVYAVRSLTVEEYGRYSIALALTTLIGLFSEFGVSGLALREMTQRPETERGILGTAVVAELITSAIAGALLVPLGFLLGYPDEVILMLALGIPFLLLAGATVGFDTAFKARRLMMYSAAVLVLQGLVGTVAGAVAITVGAGGPGLFAGLVIGQAVALAATLRFLGRTGVAPVFRGALDALLPFLRMAVPIALAGSITALYDRIDVLMVSKLASASETAIYNLPLTIQQVTLLVPAIVATAFFPLISRLMTEDNDQARAGFLLVLRIFLVVSPPIALALGIGARPLMTVVFGERYAASAAPLALLAGTVVLGFLLYLFWYLLLAAHRERRAALLMGAALAMNVGINAVLIPLDGARGAATALLISDACMVALLAVQVSRHVFPLARAELLLHPALGLAAAGALGTALFAISRTAAALAAASAYLAVLLATRYVTPDEWRPLTGPLREGMSRVSRQRL